MELPLIIRKSRWPVVVSLIGAVTVAVFLFWLPGIYSNKLQFGLAYVFCMIAAGCVVILVERKPDLVVSVEGIHASHWGSEVVLWNEIEDVFVEGNLGGDYLCLSLRRPDEYLARNGRMAKIASTVNRASGLGDLLIKPSTMGLDANELLQLVRRQIVRSRAEPQRSPSAVKYRAG